MIYLETDLPEGGSVSFDSAGNWANFYEVPFWHLIEKNIYDSRWSRWTSQAKERAFPAVPPPYPSWLDCPSSRASRSSRRRSCRRLRMPCDEPEEAPCPRPDWLHGGRPHGRDCRRGRRHDGCAGGEEKAQVRQSGTSHSWWFRPACPMRGAGRNRFPSTPRNTLRGAMRGDLSRSIGISVCECVDMGIGRHMAAGRFIWRMVVSLAGNQFIRVFLVPVFGILSACFSRPSSRILDRVNQYLRTA